MSYSHPHAPPDSFPPKISRHPMSTAVHPPTAQPSFELPKIGETRCYWSLLTYPSLSFSYLDPVLQYHLQDRAPMLLGRSLLDFVHPEDQDYVRRDLGSVLQTGNMYGSETRVRFARLSQVQKQLSEATMSVGSSSSAVSDHSPWTNHPWISAVTLDDQWMPVNLVINRPANSVILCFIHAAVDIDEYADNDPAACAITQDGRRRPGWSNWCGTGPLGNPELRDIWDALNGIASICANETEIAESRLFRFQLLSNNPSSKHGVLISWPPDSSTFPDHNVGGITAQEFAKLVTNVITSDTSPTGARTSCTKRHHGQKTLITSQGAKATVESIYIPHGAVVFACHKIVSVTPGSQAHDSLLPPSTRHVDAMLAYPSPASSHFSINRSPSTNGQPRPPQQVPSPAPSNYSIPYAYQYSSSHHGGPRWSSNYPQAAPSPSNSSSSSTWTHERPSSYLGSWSASPALTPLMGYGRTSPDQYPTYRAPPTPVSDTGADSVRNDEHDLSTSPSSTTQSRRSSLSKPNEDDGEYIPNTTMPAASNISSGMPRPSKQRKHARPVGLLQCTVCSATSSPEWRKGPSGKKELCNACGLRFARSKTKKINDGQGVVKPSKKKSKLSPALKVMVQEQHMSLSPRLPSHAQGAGSPASSSSHSAQSQSQHQSHNLPPYQDHVASYSPQMINHSPYTNHHQEAYYSAAASLASLSGASGQYFPPYDSGYTGERRERDGKHEFNYEGDGGGADGEAYDGSAEMIQVAR